MSRVAKAPITIPEGVNITHADGVMSVKGKLGEMTMHVNSLVQISNNDNVLTFEPNQVSKKLEKSAWAQAGTVRANTANLIKGVTDGWEKKLTLIGVGYRAKADNKNLVLTVGYSHPVTYQIPEGIKIETPSQTEIIVSGTDKQKIGQVASEIRFIRPPEPYKGKGIRYNDERVVKKEAKKK